MAEVSALSCSSTGAVLPTCIINMLNIIRRSLSIVKSEHPVTLYSGCWKEETDTLDMLHYHYHRS